MAKKATQTGPIRILHLSDFHFSEERKWDADPVLTGLADVVRGLDAQGLTPDLVAITGDIARTGKGEDYQVAGKWLDGYLLPAIGDGFPKERLLMVPGNHDVERGEVNIVCQSTQSALLAGADQEAIATVLGDSGQRGILLKRHDAYLKFAGRYRAGKKKLAVPWWSISLDVKGSRLYIAGLCSSWTSWSDSDRGELLLGRWQVHEMLQDAGDWSVALVHHPWSYLAEFDAEEVERKVHHECHLVLRGHLHRQQARAAVYPEDVCLELAAGSAYAGSQYPNAFQLVELGSDQQVRVHFWTWNGVNCIQDRNTVPEAPDGVATFVLKRPEPGKPPKPTPRPAEPSKYLQSLRERTAYIDIRGLQVGSGKAQRFPIDELYIPLTTTMMEPDRAARGKRKQPREDLEVRGSARVELHEALRNPRLAIVADPGAGKTTFLRRIAFALCQSWLGEDAKATEKDLSLVDRPFPILIRLAELSEHIEASRGKEGAPTTHESPAWLAHFLATGSEEAGMGLTKEFFCQRLEEGSALALLDGLDEGATEQTRTLLATIVERATQTYQNSRFVLASRPAAWQGEVVLSGFAQVGIDALDDDAIEGFLRRWCQALFPESSTQAERHLDELLGALQSRPEIHRMARNPVMLTALAVVHWNEKRLPEQRADLYESIIEWLARSREMKAGRPSWERCITLHQELALAMQDYTDGRQTQISRFEAAQAIATEWREVPEAERAQRAVQFLRDEELNSGIVVGRGDFVRFWHLTFQEYLAARGLAAYPEQEQRQRLLGVAKLYKPEWKEVVLLLAGVLYHQGRRRVDGMFSAVLHQLGEEASLADQAQCFGLLGAAVRDLSPVHYQPADKRYHQIADAIKGIFDAERSQSVDIRVAIEAAEAMGQAGDPRFAHDHLDKNWVVILAGEFWMGAQEIDRQGRNYDPEAGAREWPVHKVHLDAYQIGKYPVTVGEYRRFVEEGGYESKEYWQAGGFGGWQAPDHWDEQLGHPTRPVVWVSWFEAAAYAAWAEARLLTEAEWERAARGTEGRKYPWVDEKLDQSLLNYKFNVGHATPVGVYPRGATPDGICDLAGNVWEWCADWYGEYSSEEARDPRGPERASFRVIRGGRWGSSAGGCRSACRSVHDPVLRNGDLGFRVATVPSGK